MIYRGKIHIAAIFILFLLSNLKAQDTSFYKNTIQEYISKEFTSTNLSFKITDIASSQNKNLKHVYVVQSHRQLPIDNLRSVFTINNSGNILNSEIQLIPDLDKKLEAQSVQYEISEYKKALSTVLKDLKIDEALNPELFDRIEDKNSATIINEDLLSDESIILKRVIYAGAEELTYAFSISLKPKTSNDWWNYYISVTENRILSKINWNLSCGISHSHSIACSKRKIRSIPSSLVKNYVTSNIPSYRVFPVPVESPNHGSSSLVSGQEDPIASPFGWHDIDGQSGADYTITRGNNVHAYEDTNDQNSPGYSPDGGSNLLFDFNYTQNTQPNTYLDASITNLFYWNNIIHDVFYQYGFDEQSGNFQVNNYGKGGVGNDEVRAESQDGGGLNNANFATPPEGNRPRMQMYLWSNNSVLPEFLEITNPSSIAGKYESTSATFGPGIPNTPLSGEVILFQDNTAPTSDACQPPVNASDLNGKIVLIDRGGCAFTSKIAEAQSAGAIAVIMVNTGIAPPITMGGIDSTIVIPSIMISQADGISIKNELSSGPVNALIGPSSVSNRVDASFDNGIIAHEYGHGISIRLTGGASTSNCLNNDEQMGEGWSDWFGLMLTIQPGDSASDRRGVATFSINEPTTGTGIRPAPYSREFSINNYTYGNSNNVSSISRPHGVGFIYATALWDLTWNLIDFYGGVPDPDLINGTGGNNIAMELVMESLKLQPCNPGMLDGRDAILQADQILYGGMHKCLIWETFARRGFGFSASQGSSLSRTDQVEAFDLPLTCQVETAPPVANFSSNKLFSCSKTVRFEDLSTDIPKSWLWSFGDGTSDTIQNPTHTYSTTGTYQVRLIVGNSLGSDTLFSSVVISEPDKPYLSDTLLCNSNRLFIVENVPNGSILWTNLNSNTSFESDTLNLQNIATPISVAAQKKEYGQEYFIGPGTPNSVGNGGMHSSAFHGALNFSTSQQIEIVSVIVNADGAGNRTFILADGQNGGQTPANSDIIAQRTIFLQDGPQIVNLNFSVPGAGDYNIGGSNVDLYRNSSGANYPYEVPGIMSINSSSATTDPLGYYYYFYNITIKQPDCISPADTFTVTPVTTDFNYRVNGLNVTFEDTISSGGTAFWDFGDGTQFTGTNPSHTYSSASIYNVTLQDNSSGCAITKPVDLLQLYTETSSSNSNNISVYPNPANDILKIDFELYRSNTIKWSLLDQVGKKIRAEITNSDKGNMSINLKEYSPGAYLLLGQSFDGEINFKKKIIIQH